MSHFPYFYKIGKKPEINYLNGFEIILNLLVKMLKLQLVKNFLC